jgi:hypothetical protein
MGKIGKKLSIQSIKDAFRSSKKPHDTEKVVEEEAADPPSRSQHTPKHYHYTATEITEQKLQQYFGIIPRDGPFLFQPLDTVELVDIPGDLCKRCPPKALRGIRSKSNYSVDDHPSTTDIGVHSRRRLL